MCLMIVFLSINGVTGAPLVPMNSVRGQRDSMKTCLMIVFLSINGVTGAPLVPESSDEFCEGSVKHSMVCLCSVVVSYGYGFLYSIFLMDFR